jgi:NADH-quinone oxidoreductase subunit M
MILVYLLAILMTGAILALITDKRNPVWPRIISLVALSIDLLLIIATVYRPVSPDYKWLVDFKLDWIPEFGISLHLALDGLSLVMLLLTFFLGIIAVIISWKEINSKVGFFHFNLLLILAPFLFLLGTDAGANVFSDRHLGT